jgi:hypothetical protein
MDALVALFAVTTGNLVRLLKTLTAVASMTTATSRTLIFPHLPIFLYLRRILSVQMRETTSEIGSSA